MDIARKPQKFSKSLRRGVLAVVLLLVVAAVTVGLSRLKPAAPTVDRRTVSFGMVKRGLMVREVSGSGTLVPREVLWIPAETEGRVKRILLEPGTSVKADSVLLELSNPDLEMAALNAKCQLRSAEAALASGRVTGRNAVIAVQSALAELVSDHKVAKLKMEANEKLYQEKLLSELDMKTSRVQFETLAERIKFERERVERMAEGERAQAAVLEAEVEQAKALANLKLAQVAALRVRAGVDGVLEQYSADVGVGKRVSAGAVLAKVSNPSRLKAVLKIAESQARDARIGLPASLDVLNTTATGKVIRIDPAVVEGGVTVDVAFDTAPPEGARPDLSVTGTIQIEKLNDVVYVERPVTASENATTRIFRVVEGGAAAIRSQVQFGRCSATTVEVRNGLKPDDEVILSEMTRWDGIDRVLLK